MDSFLWNIKNQQIHVNRKEINNSQELEMRSESLWVWGNDEWFKILVMVAELCGYTEDLWIAVVK